MRIFRWLSNLTLRTLTYLELKWMKDRKLILVLYMWIFNFVTTTYEKCFLCASQYFGILDKIRWILGGGLISESLILFHWSACVFFTSTMLYLLLWIKLYFIYSIHGNTFSFIFPKEVLVLWFVFPYCSIGILVNDTN